MTRTLNRPMHHIVNGVIGEYTWNVAVAEEGNLFLEFGVPHLVIREPLEGELRAEGRADQLLRRRRIWLRGRWHLWVETPSWRIETAQSAVTSTSVDPDIVKATDELNGQKLSSFQVRVNTLNIEHLYSFDMGAQLIISWQTQTYTPGDDIYSLWEHNALAVGVGIDGNVRQIEESQY